MRFKWAAILIALVLIGSLAVTAAAQDVVRAPFSDVSADHEAAEAFAVLHALQIFEGYGDGRVGPDDLLNRAAFSKVVVAMLDATDEAEAAADEEVEFVDYGEVPSWAVGWISVASGRGIIRGYEDGRFGPGDPVRYAEAVTMLVRALGYEEFVQGGWPEGHLDAAQRIDLIEGAPADPLRVLDRSEMARLAHRAMYIPPPDPDTGAPDEKEATLIDAFRVRGYLQAYRPPQITLRVDGAGTDIQWADRVTLLDAPAVDDLLDVEVEVLLNLAGRMALIRPVEPMEEPETVEPDEEMLVHFIDVGQGDAILVETDNVTILIDAGTRSAGEIVVEYLVRRGIRELDLVIGTHPHADHIGGLIEVFRNFKVHSVIDAGVPHTTDTYADYIAEIEKQVEQGHLEFFTPEDQVMTFEGLTLSVLGPAEDLSSLNDNSVVARVDFGLTSFLFTGDAEVAAEAHLLARDVDLAADVLKVGHHGSNTSTTPEFLAAVAPDYAVICVGADNRYGHPNDEVLRRLHAAGVGIFRTDQHGTVVFTSDGETLTVDRSPWQYEEPEEEEPEEAPAVGRVNLNTATLEQLQEIVHIGEERARQIIDLRPFESVDQLTRVHGIGQVRLQDIKDQGVAYVE